MTEHNSHDDIMKAPCSIEPIAVIGLSFRLPGDANDVDGLWKLLESGESAWTPVPEDRYNGEVSTVKPNIHEGGEKNEMIAHNSQHLPGFLPPQC